MKIAFLGLGKMGAAMAPHLLKAEHEVTVWNRTRARAEALVPLGTHVADSAAEAARGVEVVFTMVTDDAALENVIWERGVLKAMSAGATHVALSTISVALSERLAEAHTQAGQRYVAAPVFGRPNVAEAARLYTVVAGRPEDVERVKPLLAAFSREVAVVSEKPSAAHAMKLGGNFLITAMIASLSESMTFAEAMGIAPGVFAQTANAALFQSPFYEAYCKLMLNPPDPPGGTVAIGEKDTRLFREAARGAKLKTPLTDEFMTCWERAIATGMRDKDWAAGYYQLTRGQMRAAPAKNA